MSTRPLARLGAGLALVAMLALLASCVKQKDETKITQAGSGTAKVTVTLDLSHMKEMMEALVSLGMASPENLQKDPTEQIDPETLKKKAEEAKGVRIISVRREIAEDKSSATLDIELEFDSLQLLYESGLVQGVEVSLTKRDDGNYELRRLLFTNVIPDVGDDPEVAAMIESTLGVFEPYLAGMEIQTVLTLPTAIVETNGEQGTGNTVTWKIGFKDVSKSEKRLQKVVFSGEGLDWKPFGEQPAAEPTTIEKDDPVPEEEVEEEPEEEPEPVETPGK